MRLRVAAIAISACLSGLSMAGESNTAGVRFAHHQPTQLTGGARDGDCQRFAGVWTGAFTQGQYGPQRIDIRNVTTQCVAELVHNPSDSGQDTVYRLPIQQSAIEFACGTPGGRCQLKLVGGELLFTFKEPSGFINTGVFRKERRVNE